MMATMGWHQSQFRSSHPMTGPSGRGEARSHMAASPMSPLAQQLKARAGNSADTPVPMRMRALGTRSPPPESVLSRTSKSVKDLRSGGSSDAPSAIQPSALAPNGGEVTVGASGVASTAVREAVPATSSSMSQTLQERRQRVSPDVSPMPRMLSRLSRPTHLQADSAAGRQKLCPAPSSETAVFAIQEAQPSPAPSGRQCSRSAESLPGTQLRDGSFRYPGGDTSAMLRRSASSKDDFVPQRCSGEAPSRRGRQESAQQRQQAVPSGVLGSRDNKSPTNSLDSRRAERDGAASTKGDARQRSLSPPSVQPKGFEEAAAINLVDAKSLSRYESLSRYVSTPVTQATAINSANAKSLSRYESSPMKEAAAINPANAKSLSRYESTPMKEASAINPAEAKSLSRYESSPTKEVSASRNVRASKKSEDKLEATSNGQDNLRQRSKGRASPTANEAEFGRRKLQEENVKLKRDVAQLQDALRNKHEGGGTSEEPSWRASAVQSNGGSPPNVSVAIAAAVASAVRTAGKEAAANAEEAVKSMEASVCPLSAKVVDVSLSDGHSGRKVDRDYSRSRETPSISRQAGNMGGDRSREKEGKGRELRMALGRSSPSSRVESPRSSHVVQLQRQLKEKEEIILGSRQIEENLRGEIHRLEAQLKQLLAAQNLASQYFQGEAVSSEDVLKTDEDHRCFLERQVAELTKDHLRSEEELRRVRSEAGDSLQHHRHEREQWRGEREAILSDKRRLEKAVEHLRRQQASTQERLDNTMENATQHEQERRQLKSQVQALEKEKSKAECDGREAELLAQNEELKEQVHRCHVEIQRWRQQCSRLEGDCNEVHARLAAETQARSHTRGRGRTSNHGGRGHGSVATLGRRGVPAGRSIGILPLASVPAGRSIGILPLASHGSQFEASSVNNQVMATSLSLDRIQPLVSNDSLAARSRSASASSCSSSSSESSAGSSSVETATHQSSFAQPCAVFGDERLGRIPDVGWYFRLRIISATSGWMGGFGIGVTLSTPTDLATLPERAHQVKHSWLAGYWGRTFSNGKQRFCDWKPQDLQPNDEVGFLVTMEGECVVYVNDQERCRFGDPNVSVMTYDEPELTALVDVLPVPTRVEFMPGAPPPPSACVRRAGEADGDPGCTPSPSSEASPPPPPPSPSPMVEPQPRGSPLANHPARHGGTASSPVPPLQALRQGGSSATTGANHQRVSEAIRKVPQLPLPLKS